MGTSWYTEEWRIEARNLKSNPPKEVAKYREILHKHLSSHNVFNRLDRLSFIDPPDWTEGNEVELNEIDDRITEGLDSRDESLP